MREKDKSIERLKKILVNNKSFIPSGIYNSIKYDILKVLKSYFSIKKEDIDVNIEIDDKGKYSIDIKVNADKASKLNVVESSVDTL